MFSNLRSIVVPRSHGKSVPPDQNQATKASNPFPSSMSMRRVKIEGHDFGNLCEKMCY